MKTISLNLSDKTKRIPSSSVGKPGLLLLYIVALCLLGLSCKKDDAVPLAPWYPAVNNNGEPVSAVFESRVPCSNCERTKVALVIYKNEQTNLPTSYMLSRIYVGNGNERFVSEGSLTITQGTESDSTATVYELDANAPSDFKLFWKIDEQLLLILDENRKPKVGDASHGYILNRIS